MSLRIKLSVCSLNLLLLSLFAFENRALACFVSEQGLVYCDRFRFNNQSCLSRLEEDLKSAMLAYNNYEFSKTASLFNSILTKHSHLILSILQSKTFYLQMTYSRKDIFLAAIDSYFKTNQFQKVLELYQWLPSIFDKVIEARYILAATYYRLDRQAEAESTYYSILDSDLEKTKTGNIPLCRRYFSDIILNRLKVKLETSPQDLLERELALVGFFSTTNFLSFAEGNTFTSFLLTKNQPDSALSILNYLSTIRPVQVSLEEVDQLISSLGNIGKLLGPTPPNRSTVQTYNSSMNAALLLKAKLLNQRILDLVRAVEFQENLTYRILSQNIYQISETIETLVTTKGHTAKTYCQIKKHLKEIISLAYDLLGRIIVHDHLFNTYAIRLNTEIALLDLASAIGNKEILDALILHNSARSAFSQSELESITNTIRNSPPSDARDDAIKTLVQNRAETQP